jgi:hypothetical protein
MLKNTRYKKASSRIARRSEIKRVFGLIWKIGLPVVFLVGLVLFLRADFWQVKNFEVIGTETISAEDLKKTTQSQTLGNKFLLLPKSNIIFLNKNNLANILLSDFARIEKVEINKQFFSQQIELKITERKAEFLWCAGETECFSMTALGLVFESHSAEAPRDKLIFKGILEGDPLMQNFATPTQIQNYLKLVEYFDSAGFQVNIVNVESNNKAVAQISVGNLASDVIFDPTETDLVLTAQNVILLIKETKIKNPSAHFQYIDARFGNKFFYKLY